MTNLITCCGKFVFFVQNQTDLVVLNASNGSVLSQTTFHAPICALAASPDRQQIAVAVSKQADKTKENMIVFDIIDSDGSISPVIGAVLPHDGVQLCLTKVSDRSSVLALNSGDIDCIDFETRKSRTLLGSIVAGTSFALNSAKSFIVSADREARIRVSHFPNTYEIESFAFLHEEIVSSVIFIDDERFASCDGDGLVVLWGLDGKPITSQRIFPETTMIRQLLSVSGEIYAIAEGVNDVYVLDQKLKITRKISLPGPPISMSLSNDGNVWILCFEHVICLSGDSIKVTLPSTLGHELQTLSLEGQRVKSKKIVKKSNKDDPDLVSWRHPQKSHRED